MTLRFLVFLCIALALAAVPHAVIAGSQTAPAPAPGNSHRSPIGV